MITDNTYFQGYDLRNIENLLNGQLYLYQSRYTLKYLKNLQNKESGMSQNFQLSNKTEFESVARQMFLTDSIMGLPHNDFLPKCHICDSDVSWVNATWNRYNIRRLGDKVVYLCDHCFSHLTKCEFCHSDILATNENTIILDGNRITICEDCKTDGDYFACDNCQNYTTNETSYNTIHGDSICGVCEDTIFVRCDDCYDYCVRDESFSVANGDVICEHCIDNYSYCESCCEYYPQDLTYYSDRTCEVLCENCHSQTDNHENLRGYHDNPEKVFHRTMDDRLNDNKVYFGFELEVECDDIYSACDTLYDLSDNENYLYLMQDGSLDHGFELISQPMTLDFHKTQMRWDNVLSQMRRYDCNGDCHTTGLHVHISKRYISDKTQIKIAYFVHMFHDYFEKLARRESTYYTRYEDKNLAENATSQQRTRYESVNFENRATIEFRIFQSTTNYHDLISALELVDAIVKFCEVSSNEVFIQNDKTTQLFERFVIASKTYDHLPKYIEELTR